MKENEVTNLFREELTKHLAILRDGSVRRESWILSIESLEGAARMLERAPFADALKSAAKLLKSGDEKGRSDAVRLVEAALAGDEIGLVGRGPAWPEPPADLPPRSIDESLRAHYVNEVADRMSQLDSSLSPDQDAISALLDVYRHVHTIKGAASAAGDAPMAWFCHGLEERLRVVPRNEKAAKDALQMVSRYRGALGAFAEDPEAALLILRSKGASVPPQRAAEVRRAREDDATVRVDAHSVDRLLDRLIEMDWMREQSSAKSARVREVAMEVRRLRAEVEEALRLIGPPKPWGAPAHALRKIERAAKVLARVGEDLNDVAHTHKESDTVLRENSGQMKMDLSHLRHAPVGRLFRRIRQAVLSEAEREKREVDVRFVGAEESIDRQLADDLVEPLLQLARNAIAHGIETPDVREARGKDRRATVKLSAKKRAGRLVLSVTDDGAGVDLERVRLRAVEEQILTLDESNAMDTDSLLGTLFLPGFSTKETTDLLAGRGMGLDIVLARVRRLGGTVRLSNLPGEGLEVKVEIPIDGGVASALWVRAGSHRVAFVSSHVKRVCGVNDIPGDHSHLAACIDGKEEKKAKHLIELELSNGDPFFVGVDEIYGVEDAPIRPLSPLVSRLGPFRGAMLRPDGSLCLVIDAFTLATRARVHERRKSDFPRAMG